MPPTRTFLLITLILTALLQAGEARADAAAEARARDERAVAKT